MITDLATQLLYSIVKTPLIIDTERQHRAGPRLGGVAGIQAQPFIPVKTIACVLFLSTESLLQTRPPD